MDDAEERCVTDALAQVRQVRFAIRNLVESWGMGVPSADELTRDSAVVEKTINDLKSVSKKLISIPVPEPKRAPFVVNSLGSSEGASMLFKRLHERCVVAQKPMKPSRKSRKSAGAQALRISPVFLPDEEVLLKLDTFYVRLKSQRHVVARMHSEEQSWCRSESRALQLVSTHLLVALSRFRNAYSREECLDKFIVRIFYLFCNANSFHRTMSTRSMGCLKPTVWDVNTYSSMLLISTCLSLPPSVQWIPTHPIIHSVFQPVMFISLYRLRSSLLSTITIAFINSPSTSGAQLLCPVVIRLLGHTA